MAVKSLLLTSVSTGQVIPEGLQIDTQGNFSFRIMAEGDNPLQYQIAVNGEIIGGPWYSLTSGVPVTYTLLSSDLTEPLNRIRVTISANQGTLSQDFYLSLPGVYVWEYVKLKDDALIIPLNNSHKYRITARSSNTYGISIYGTKRSNGQEEMIFSTSKDSMPELEVSGATYSGIRIGNNLTGAGTGIRPSYTLLKRMPIYSGDPDNPYRVWEYIPLGYLRWPAALASTHKYSVKLLSSSGYGIRIGGVRRSDNVEELLYSNDGNTMPELEVSGATYSALKINNKYGNMLGLEDNWELARYLRMKLNSPPTISITSPADNLLGTDGNCEDTSKFTYTGGTAALDSTRKTTGSNSIKVTKTNATSSIYSLSSKRIYPVVGDYYIAIAEVYLENVASQNGLFNTTNGVTLTQKAVTGSTSGFAVTTTGAFVPIIHAMRVDAVTKPGVSYFLPNLLHTGTSGHVFNVDSFRVYKITQAEYDALPTNVNLATAQAIAAQYPYVDPNTNQTLAEGNVFSIQGSAGDTDSGNVVTVKFKINGGTARAIASGVSDGSSPISFAKNLTYSNKRLWDGSTDVAGADLAEGVDHTLTVWAEDDQGGQSVAVTRSFTVKHNKAPALTVNTFTPVQSGLIPPDTITLSGTASDPDGNTVTVKGKLNTGTEKTLLSGVSSGNWSFLFKVSELKTGANTITITATDQFGAVTVKTFNVKNEVVEKPMKKAVARYKILPPLGSAKEILAWQKREKGDLVIDAEASFVDAGQPEQYVAMAKDSVDLTTEITEDEFVGTAAAPKADVIFKQTLSRTNANSTQAATMLVGVFK
ncbi:hypothetical protein [Brevibacillus borstelensis]|uniref:hypothetical protein n=1 Tax=Brevibacillus borstelensis TaxID=45462 RepID=UPI0030FCDEEF